MVEESGLHDDQEAEREKDSSQQGQNMTHLQPLPTCLLLPQLIPMRGLIHLISQGSHSPIILSLNVLAFSHT